jgi:hypothetical protein
MNDTTSTVDHVLAAFGRQTGNSSPGVFGVLYDALPDSLSELCHIVQNCVIHLFWIREATYGTTLAQLKVSGRRLCEEFGYSTIEQRLGSIVALKDSPLAEARPAALRSVGCCRDFALMLVSILRHKGIPARVRTGVALYLDPNHPEDHYVTELWNADERRWQMVDPQIDAVQREAMRLTVDTTDLPPGSFLTGRRLLDAMCSGTIQNADKIGFPPTNAGLAYGRHKLFADFVSLTGREIPVHAWWGIGAPESVEPGDDALIDRMIALTRGIDQNDPAALREALRLSRMHPRLRMPADYRVPPWAPDPGWGLDV